MRSANEISGYLSLSLSQLRSTSIRKVSCGLSTTSLLSDNFSSSVDSSLSSSWASSEINQVKIVNRLSLSCNYICKKRCRRLGRFQVTFNLLASADSHFTGKWHHLNRNYSNIHTEDSGTRRIMFKLHHEVMVVSSTLQK